MSAYKHILCISKCVYTFSLWINWGMHHFLESLHQSLLSKLLVHNSQLSSYFPDFQLMSSSPVFPSRGENLWRFGGLFFHVVKCMRGNGAAWGSAREKDQGSLWPAGAGRGRTRLRTPALPNLALKRQPRTLPDLGVSSSNLGVGTAYFYFKRSVIL